VWIFQIRTLINDKPIFPLSVALIKATWLSNIAWIIRSVCTPFWIFIITIILLIFLIYMKPWAYQGNRSHVALSENTIWEERPTNDMHRYPHSWYRVVAQPMWWYLLLWVFHSSSLMRMEMKSAFVLTSFKLQLYHLFSLCLFMLKIKLKGSFWWMRISCISWSLVVKIAFVYDFGFRYVQRQNCTSARNKRTVWNLRCLDSAVAASNIR